MDQFARFALALLAATRREEAQAEKRPTPADVARARRNSIARSVRMNGKLLLPMDYSVAGNARITVTPSGKRSRSGAANALRKYAR